MTTASATAGIPARALALLSALAAALAFAFVVAPIKLAGNFADEPAIAAAVRTGFNEFWASGSSPALQNVVDYWFRYHVAKGAIDALLLAVLVYICVLLWRAQRKKTAIAVAPLALLALAIVMANVQGAIAPFASLMPMLMDGPAGATIDQVRSSLSNGVQHSAQVTAMVNDFALYHVAMAVIAGVVAAGFIAMAVMFRKKRGISIAAGLLSLGVIVIAVANAGTAADPAPALLALFQGGW